MIALMILKWLLYALVALAVIVLAAGQLGLLEGTPPADLGATDGKLKPPSGTPNSVSSQANLYPDHSMRAYADIAPLPIQGDAGAALERVKRIVEAMPGASIVKIEPGYLYAQFKTPWLKFVDDTEFLANASAGVIHVRSASRLGRKDFGVNRARIEAIRARYGG